MSMGKWLITASLLVASGSMLLADEPKPAGAPATQPTDAKPVKAKKLVEPWSMLKDLTPDQTAQIEKIHAEALEQTKKIYTKEVDDITAVLTPAQVTELKIAEAKKALEAKERRAKMDAPTTAPTK